MLVRKPSLFLAELLYETFQSQANVAGVKAPPDGFSATILGPVI